MKLLALALIALLLVLLAMLALSWQAQRRQQGLVARRLAHHVAKIRQDDRAELGEPPMPANWVGRQLFRARMSWRWLFVLGFVAVLLLVAARMLWLDWLETAMLAPALAGLVALTVRAGITRNLNRLHDALPNFLDRLRQQILIGASVPQALQRAVAVSPPVIRWVFEPVERRVLAGGELVETLEWAARRHGGEAGQPFAAAVSASLRYGGRLSEAIANLSQMERMRVQVHQEMHGATAEVRASSLILALLPVGVAAFMFLTSPAHRSYFLDPDRGRTLLYGIIGLYLFGLFLLRQIAQPRF
jgi:tight adherence protein B